MLTKLNIIGEVTKPQDKTRPQTPSKRSKNKNVGYLADFNTQNIW